MTTRRFVVDSNLQEVEALRRHVTAERNAVFATLAEVSQFDEDRLGPFMELAIPRIESLHAMLVRVLDARTGELTDEATRPRA
jgi:hypothetical protein